MKVKAACERVSAGRGDSTPFYIYSSSTSFFSLPLFLLLKSSSFPRSSVPAYSLNTATMADKHFDIDPDGDTLIILPYAIWTGETELAAEYGFSLHNGDDEVEDNEMKDNSSYTAENDSRDDELPLSRSKVLDDGMKEEANLNWTSLNNTKFTRRRNFKKNIRVRRHRE